MHAVVREQLEPFLAEAREQISHGHGLPALVEQELRAISTHPRARPPEPCDRVPEYDVVNPVYPD